MRASNTLANHVNCGSTAKTLQAENHIFQGTGGVSRHNRHAGFRPAFCDLATGRVYLSRTADGQLATVHVLDGLPDDVVLQRDAKGHVILAKPTVVTGFIRCGHFYTRAEAEYCLRTYPKNPA